LCQDNQNEFYKHKKGATSLWRNWKYNFSLHEKLRLRIICTSILNQQTWL
jgi:hypothetical protein